MNVLAFETCFSAVSVAVRWRSVRGEWLLREAYQPLAVGHAERLLPLIDEVLSGAGLRFDDINRIAVTIGPGGFTGLRVGIAAARAFSLATGHPVVGMTSLSIMAERAILLLGPGRVDRPIMVAVDARRGAHYVQVFGENAGDPLSAACLATAGEAAAKLPPEPTLVVGSGAEAVCLAAGRADVEAALPDLQPHARQLALLAPALPVLAPLTPLYLRAADAKPSSVPPLSRRSGP